MGCAQSLLQTDADIQEEYELGKRLGKGVQGEVYLARHKATGDLVAIKLVRRGEELGLGPEKLRREIQLQARLSHVNIVELKQVILTRRHLGIVMSYADGGDLQAYCNKYQMNETVARFVFRQMVSAIAYCHANRVAHRDLKLANFLLTTSHPMTVKLADFGCASRWERSGPPAQMGRMKTFAGTPAYMAPQVLESAFYPTNTYSAMGADVWSLGILLTHMFFGDHTPYWLDPGMARTEAATMQARMALMRGSSWVDSDPFLTAHAGSLSPELRDLLDKIFVADEGERITVKGIQAHPWVTGPLPPDLEAALAHQEEEQALRDGLRRAAVSTTAGRHDTANTAGEFATIDLLVEMATCTRRMPPGHRQCFSLDMAHLSDGPSSMATSFVTADTDASGLADLSVHMVSREPEGAAGAHARDSAGSIHSKTGKLAPGGGDRSRRGGSRHGGAAGVNSSGSKHGGSLYAGADGGSRRGGSAYMGGGSRHGGSAYTGGGSRHGGSRRGGGAYAAALESSRHGARATSQLTGDASGSVHAVGSNAPAAPASSIASLGGLEGLGSLVGSDVAGDLDQTCDVPSTVATTMFRKTLNLQRSHSGLVVASYMLEPSTRGGSVYSGGGRGDASPH